MLTDDALRLGICALVYAKNTLPEEFSGLFGEAAGTLAGVRNGRNPAPEEETEHSSPSILDEISGLFEEVGAIRGGRRT